MHRIKIAAEFLCRKKHLEITVTRGLKLTIGVTRGPTRTLGHVFRGGCVCVLYRMHDILNLARPIIMLKATHLPNDGCPSTHYLMFCLAAINVAHCQRGVYNFSVVSGTPRCRTKSGLDGGGLGSFARIDLYVVRVSVCTRQ